MASKVIALLVALCAMVSAETTFPPPEQGLQKVQVPTTGEGTRAVSFFYFSTFATGFDEAVAYCRQSGLQLINIKTHAKQNEVVAAMFEINNSSPQWINLWWRNNAWYWGDNTRALYLNFFSSTTDPGWRHYINPNNNNLWAKETISHPMFFMCENVY